jgi:small-conductance mechanosensitive channel
METAEAAQYELTERRIAHLTLIVGALAAGGAMYLYSFRVGGGVLIGAVLAWINFRWLEHALNAVTRASVAQAGSPQASVPVLSYLGMIARYALIALAVYVIFSRLQIPILSMLVGLCALGVAAMTATVWEVMSPAGRRNE